MRASLNTVLNDGVKEKSFPQEKKINIISWFKTACLHLVTFYSEQFIAVFRVYKDGAAFLALCNRPLIFLWGKEGSVCLDLIDSICDL